MVSDLSRAIRTGICSRESPGDWAFPLRFLDGLVMLGCPLKTSESRFHQ